MLSLSKHDEVGYRTPFDKLRVTAQDQDDVMLNLFQQPIIQDNQCIRLSKWGAETNPPAAGRFGMTLS